MNYNFILRHSIRAKVYDAYPDVDYFILQKPLITAKEQVRRRLTRQELRDLINFHNELNAMRHRLAQAYDPPEFHPIYTNFYDYGLRLVRDILEALEQQEQLEREL